MRVFGIDAVQAHAQAVFDHGHSVVAEAAEGAQIVPEFIAARAAVSDVLHRGGGGLAKDAQPIVVAKPVLTAVLVLAVGVIRSRAGRGWGISLRWLSGKRYATIGTNTQLAAYDESGLMRGRVKSHRHVVPDEGIVGSLRLAFCWFPIEQAVQALGLFVSL
jgi:hypothetical protein